MARTRNRDRAERSADATRWLSTRAQRSRGTHLRQPARAWISGAAGIAAGAYGLATASGLTSAEQEFGGGPSYSSGTLLGMSARTVSELVDLTAAGARVKYLHFWGHRPQRDGGIGAGCLSQWWPAPFTVDGYEFATAEHYMMWSKATLFGDDEIAGKVLASGHPQRAKALGRQVRGFNQSVWDEHRYGIVVAGSVAKFGQHAELREFLLGTRDRVLVEASPVDRIWGIGLTATDPRATDPRRWRGLNLLGFALMEARSRLRDRAS